MGSAAATPADTLTAATEALKAAQLGLKGSRGSRLGQGSQLEREEATTSKAAGSETVAPTTTAALPTVAKPAATQDIASLRKALGIDDLLTNLRGMAEGEAKEVPEFEMPEFEMPQFELPDFEGMFANAFAQYAPKQDTSTPGTPQVSTPTTATTKANKVTVGNKTYNLSKTGGSGLGSQDIKLLQKKGWSKSEIKQVAKQAPKVSTGAQKLLGAAKKPSVTQTAPSQKAQTTAKKLVSSAKTAIAKAVTKPAAKGGTKKK